MRSLPTEAGPKAQIEYYFCSYNHMVNLNNILKTPTLLY